MKLQNVEKVNQRLLKLLNKVQHPEPMLDEIGRELHANTVARILFTKKAPDGRTWAPWAPSTAAARNRKGNAGQGLLYDSGTLANSIRYVVTGKQVTVGVDNVPYAIFLQEGTTRMPARPFIGFSNEDAKAIRRIMIDHFRGVRT